MRGAPGSAARAAGAELCGEAGDAGRVAADPAAARIGEAQTRRAGSRVDLLNLAVAGSRTSREPGRTRGRRGSPRSPPAPSLSARHSHTRLRGLFLPGPRF